MLSRFNGGGQPIKSARAIDFYPFYHICEQNAFIVGKEEPLTMHLSAKYFLSLHVIGHFREGNLPIDRP